MQREGHAPDHATEKLAANQPGVNDAPGRERADHAGDPNLAKVRIDLDLGKDGPVGVHRVLRLRSFVRSARSARLQLGSTGARDAPGVALAAGFVVPPDQTASAGNYAGIASPEQGRPLVTGRDIGKLSDDSCARIVNGEPRGRGMGGAAGDAGIW